MSGFSRSTRLLWCATVRTYEPPHAWLPTDHVLKAETEDLLEDKIEELCEELTDNDLPSGVHERWQERWTAPAPGARSEDTER